jgi:two-component system nitrate/nitrite response regulator NarL
MSDIISDICPISANGPLNYSPEHERNTPMVGSQSLLILILEDQSLVRAGMRELVQICEPHSQIHEASTYDEAIKKLTSQRYDIAFLDVDLKSERTGVDLLQRLRDLEIDTRAVMLSGRTERALVMRCIEAGACGYISKDMDSDGLFRRALDTIFQGGVFLPATVLGRGGYTPNALAAPPAVAVESLGLKGRILEVLYYLCQGMPNKSIANKMGIEEATVRKDYVSRLLEIFGVARRTELIVEISRRGIIIPRPN